MMTLPVKTRLTSAKIARGATVTLLLAANLVASVNSARAEAEPSGEKGPKRLLAQLNDYQKLSIKHKTAGRTALLQHDIPTALSEFRTYRDLQPADPEGHFYLGYCLSQSGGKQDAIKEYGIAEDQALGYDMDCPELRINRGNLMAQLGRNREAESEYRRAIEVDPLAAEAHLDLARLMLGDGRTDAALRELNDCAATRANDPRFCFLQGIAGMEKGQFDSAADWFRKCQVTSNQSTFSSSPDSQLSAESEKLLQLLEAPGL
jgi:Flp pilus assembly protein TadD